MEDGAETFPVRACATAKTGKRKVRAEALRFGKRRLTIKKKPPSGKPAPADKTSAHMRRAFLSPRNGARKFPGRHRGKQNRPGFPCRKRTATETGARPDRNVRASAEAYHSLPALPSPVPPPGSKKTRAKSAFSARRERHGKNAFSRNAETCRRKSAAKKRTGPPRRLPAKRRLLPPCGPLPAFWSARPRLRLRPVSRPPLRVRALRTSPAARDEDASFAADSPDALSGDLPSRRPAVGLQKISTPTVRSPDGEKALRRENRLLPAPFSGRNPFFIVRSFAGADSSDTLKIK